MSNNTHPPPDATTPRQPAAHAQPEQPSREPTQVPTYLVLLAVSAALAVIIGGAVLMERNKTTHCGLLCAEDFMRHATPESIITEITSGADPEAQREQDRMTALHVAARFNPDPAVAALLIKLGADLMAQDEDNNTPLHAAAANPNSGVSLLLLEMGADLAARNIVLNTPLHQAAHSNPNPEISKLLLERGAVLEQKGEVSRTALHYAAWWNEPQVTALLLEHGAEVTARDEFGVTPLHYAALWNRPEVAKLLLDYNADPDTPTQVDGMTPLHAAARENQDPKMTTLLLEYGADPALRDTEGRQASDYAAQNPALKDTEIPDLLRTAAGTTPQD